MKRRSNPYRRQPKPLIEKVDMKMRVETTSNYFGSKVYRVCLEVKTKSGSFKMFIEPRMIWDILKEMERAEREGFISIDKF